MNLRTLSHEDFLRHAYMQAATELEREMLRRLEAPGFDQDLLSAMQEGTLDAQKVRGFTSLLSEYDIETPEDLRATLDEGSAYKAAASDCGVFSPDALFAALDKGRKYEDAAKEHDIESPSELIDALHQLSNQNPERKEA